MTRKATRIPPTRDVGGESDLKHYTPEQVYDNGWLPWRPRTIREKCQRGEIPHSKTDPGPRGHIYFRLPQIREIALGLEVRPIRETKPLKSAA